MKKSTIALLSVVGVLVILVLSTISINNSIIRKEEAVNASWSQVENVYQRRMDLIPNLVNTVKGYASHEKETLENVIKARNQALQTTQQMGATGTADAKNLEKFQRAQESLGSALGRLLVVVERYPNLKASQNFRDLQIQLEGTENRITVERRRFNETARDYNTYIRTFPTVLFANMRGFKARPYFEAQEGAATAPKVEF